MFPDSQGYFRNAWVNVTSEGDAYLRGVSGMGLGNGKNGGTSLFSVSTPTPNEDWYFKIEKKL